MAEHPSQVPAAFINSAPSSTHSFEKAEKHLPGDDDSGASPNKDLPEDKAHLGFQYSSHAVHPETHLIDVKKEKALLRKIDTHM
jgi:hypothetical protein